MFLWWKGLAPGERATVISLTVSVVLFWYFNLRPKFSIKGMARR